MDITLRNILNSFGVVVVERRFIMDRFWVCPICNDGNMYLHRKSGFGIDDWNEYCSNCTNKFWWG